MIKKNGLEKYIRLSAASQGKEVRVEVDDCAKCKAYTLFETLRPSLHVRS